MLDVPLLIGGQSCPARDGRTFERRNPVTGEVVSRVAAATLEDADAAVAAAQTAFPAWAALAPNERRTRLLKAAEQLQARSDEFIAAAGETGAMANWYGFNVRLAANILREAASMTTQITGDVIPSDVPGSFAMALRQPCGVVLGIAPWNAPVILATRAIAMPLACGNTVVLEASELSPAVHRLIGQVSAGRRPGRWRGQRHQQRPGGCGGDCRTADRQPGGASGQLHRLNPCRADRR